MQVQTQTTVTDISDSSVLRYDFLAQAPSFERTSSNPSRERQSLLSPALKHSTEEELGIPTAKIFSFPIEKPYINVAPAQAKNYVTGVIVSYDEISVKCEMNVDEKVVSIQLPRSLFPEVIHYGLPINLKVIEEDGFRRPVITLRKIDEKSTADIAAEFDSILNAL